MLPGISFPLGILVVLGSAFIGAAAFSLSSTAMVVKILQGKNLSGSLPGEIMITWLLIQDLLSLPFSSQRRPSRVKVAGRRFYNSTRI